MYALRQMEKKPLVERSLALKIHGCDVGLLRTELGIRRISRDF